jgi:hypothetical protein
VRTPYPPTVSPRSVLAPGWVRTELVLHAFKADEGGCCEVEALRRIDAVRRARDRGPGPPRAGDA